MRGHGDRDGFVAGGEDGWGNAITFTAENDAGIAAEIGLRQDAFVGVRMGGDAANAARAELLQTLDEGEFGGVGIDAGAAPLANAGEFHDGQLQDGAHGIADGPAQERAAGSFTDDERLHAEGDAIAHECAQIFGVGQGVERDEEARRRTFREDFFEGNRRGNSADGKHALEHGKAGERFEQFFFGDENGDVFGPFIEQRLKLREPFFREDDGFDGEMALKQARDNFGAFGDENAFLLVIARAAHGGVGLKFRGIEGFDFADVKHGAITK